MDQSSVKRYFCLLFFLAAALPLGAQTSQGYAGSAACARCHAGIHREWADSHHATFLGPANPQTVRGDFSRENVELGGSSYVLRQSGGSYFITESDLSGKPWEHRLDYVLGGRRVQQYLATLPDGSIVVLPPAWDVLRGQWVFSLDLHNPEQAPGDVAPVWNKSCFGCHVSREEKNFDVAQMEYHTTWSALGVDCETCHGPGSRHVAAATVVAASDSAARATLRKTIVNPARLNPARSTMVCAQCHSFRDIYALDFSAGDDFLDYYLPVLEARLPQSDDAPFWLDGRPRWLANSALALWQSRCFLKGGATCITCQSRPHSGMEKDARLRQDPNAVCTKCHSTIAAQVSTHSHHAPKSTGSSCVECHMPAAVTGVNATIRDHSMSIPSPENTLRHGIPNSCNLCHKQKDAKWAAEAVTTWYGAGSGRELVARADAFTAARKGSATAIPDLLKIASDSSAGAWVRANAVAYLGAFPNDPAAYDSAVRFLNDTEPLVRATAATSIRPRAAQRAELAPALVALLKDPVRTVRMSAAIALVALGVQLLPGEDGERFRQANALYRARAQLNSDDAVQEFAAGKYFLLTRDANAAVDAFRAAMKLDPEIRAQYDLALALAQKGDIQEASQILGAIPRTDPAYPAAQRTLAELEAKSPTPGAPASGSATPKPTSQGESLFLRGQLLYQNESYAEALDTLGEALQLEPQAGWATKARIYRAICLERLARTGEAEAAFQELSGEPAAAHDVDLQLAYAELLDETSRVEDALKRLDALVAAVPDAPMARFWRAKVLLQLQRTDEAAREAEESIRLLPQSPQAHNLLLRIYLMQGRTKEAAEQAQWLRDYQRRKESQ